MSSVENKEQRLTQTWWFFPALIAAIYFAAHMATATRYGYFRDALYYLACSEHLDWGYVDQPPLIAVIGWIARHTLGISLQALLVWPALAGCGRILLTAAFAHELGTQRFGTTLAAVLAATPAVWYVLDHQFAMNALEPLFWTGCAYALLRMINTGNVRLWLTFGAIGGLGLENKYSMSFFALAIGRRIVADAAAQVAVHSLAAGGHRRGAADFSAQSSVEYLSSVAISRAHAQYSSLRQGHRASAYRVYQAADFDDEPADLSVLARRVALLFFRASRPRLTARSGGRS